MTKTIIALFGLVLASCAWAADTAATTADRHQKMGVQCVACHKDGNTALPVRKAQCRRATAATNHWLNVRKR